VDPVLKERPATSSSRRRVTTVGGAGSRIAVLGSNNRDPDVYPTAGLCSNASIQRNPGLKVTLRDTCGNREAGAMRPVRRAGWVWATCCSPAEKKLRGLSVRAQARGMIISLLFSVVGVSSFLPLRVARWGAARGSAIQVLGGFSLVSTPRP